MPLINVLIVLIIIGAILFLVNTYGGSFIDPKFLKIINVVMVVATVIWILSLFFGGFGSLSTIRVGK